MIIALIQLGSYIYTAIINPGLPKYEYENLIYSDDHKNLRRCKDCKMWINTEEKTFHCYECEICIEGIVIIIKIGFDHHCPWTSKCIGNGNLKSFYTFIGFTMVLFGYLIFSVSLINPNNN